MQKKKTRETIKISQWQMEVVFVESNRKTIAIEVNINGEVIVRTPYKVKREYIYELLRDKEDWIVKSRNKILESNKNIKKEVFKEGETVLFNGKSFELKIIVNYNFKKDIIFIENDKIVITTKCSREEEVKDIYYTWCKKQLKIMIEERIEIYSKYFSLKPSKVLVKEQKRRWGSCSYDNKLMFNWRLYKVSTDKLDYVVIHEMCHMIYKDHSKKYWNCVQSILPNYKEIHSWFKENGSQIMQI